MTKKAKSENERDCHVEPRHFAPLIAHQRDMHLLTDISYDAGIAYGKISAVWGHLNTKDFTDESILEDAMNMLSKIQANVNELITRIAGQKGDKS